MNKRRRYKAKRRRKDRRLTAGDLQWVYSRALRADRIHAEFVKRQEEIYRAIVLYCAIPKENL